MARYECVIPPRCCPAALPDQPRNPAESESSDVASGNMTLGTLIKGLALLVLLLIAPGQLGNIGPVELLIWLALVVAWITLWVTRRARASATP